MGLIKRSGAFYLQIRRGGRLMLVPTGSSREREAQVRAREITAMFDREKRARALSSKLCEYALALAREEITAKGLLSPLKALEAQAQTQALEVIERLFPARKVTAKSLWERYMESSPKLKPNALATKKARFSRFAEWAGDMDMNDIDGVAAQSFLATLKVSAQTWNNYVFDIGSVFSELGLENPFRNLQQTGVTHKERTPMDFDTARRVLALCDASPEELAVGIPLRDWGRFLRVLYYTGLRPSDIATLSRDEFIEGARIELLPEKTSRTRKKVSIVAQPQLRELLNAIIAEDGDKREFFPEIARRYRQSPALLPHAFKKIMERLGIKGEGTPTLYGFRHLYVTYQASQGNKMDDIAAAVGHSTTGVTDEFYYHGKHGVSLSDMPEI